MAPWPSTRHAVVDLGKALHHHPCLPDGAADAEQSAVIAVGAFILGDAPEQRATAQETTLGRTEVG